MRKIIVISALSMVFAGCAKAPTFTFLSKVYHLGSFNQKNAATWEYVTGAETRENWTTLITMIDRPDAKALTDMDRLAEGILATYKGNHGQILMAKTIQGKVGGRYNYLVAAFDEPAKQRFEMNFVKVAMGPKNAYVLVYAARVSDAVDYRTKGKDFVNQNSAEIGKALETAVVPEFSTLPRKVF